MTGAQIGLIGGVVGSLIGIAGGVFGTWLSIKNTKTSEERAFMVHAALAMWLAIVALLLLPLILEMRGVLPSMWRMVGMAIFFLGLGPSILYVNRKSAELRGEMPVRPTDPVK